MGQILDSGIESKKVNPLETIEVPVTITSKISGLYILEVIAQYGIYQSKTSKVFFNDNVISLDVMMSIAIILAALIVTIAALYFIRNERRKRRRF